MATLEDIAAWDADAARAAESSLRRLQLLPPPPVGQALMEQFFSEAVEEIDLLRQSAAAASAGEETHALEKKRVDAVHRKDAWVISSRRAGG